MILRAPLDCVPLCKAVEDSDSAFRAYVTGMNSLIREKRKRVASLF